MLIRFVHSNGTQYTYKVSQVVVCSDNGQPVACTYQQAGVIVHSDATQDDFGKVIDDLRVGLKAGKVEIVES